MLNSAYDGDVSPENMFHNDFRFIGDSKGFADDE
jgi:hypothetical protein